MKNWKGIMKMTRKEEIQKLIDEMTPNVLLYVETLMEHYEKLEKENQQLKEQLDYIRSGEYYNQLRFERDMLQVLVEKGEISKEDKEFIDCTHRNTELLEENKQLKERIEYLERSNNRREEEIIALRQELADSEVCREKAIEYCNNNIEFTERLIDVIDILKGDNNE